ncbi:MAG: family 43 glycosylhydrolase [Spirochaetes bacterium]|nr:family 43 glycosylhydrolase [Spirochaetota bacterium]
MIFTDIRRGRPFAKDPAVIRFRERYIMYYSIPPWEDGRAGDGYAIGIAESDDLDRWKIIGEILPEGAIEAKGLCAPDAVVLEGKVNLFYQTYGNGKNDAICHAVSDDGITFRRHPENPVFRPSGDWNAGRAIDADVVVADDRLYLFWATRDPAMKIQMPGVSSAALNSGFGKTAWKQLNTDGPILRPELPWEGDCIEAPAVCRHDGRWFMWYGGSYNATPQQIGCAVSDDGIRWKRIGSEPWLRCGRPGEWNQHESGHPYVFVDTDGATHLFYQGTGDKGKTWWLTRIAVEWRDGLPLPGK